MNEKKKMKKLSITFFVLVFTLALSQTVIAGPKVPKELCIEGDEVGIILLTFKKASKIRGYNVKRKYYTVQGQWNHLPQAIVNLTAFSRDKLVGQQEKILAGAANLIL